MPTTRILEGYTPPVGVAYYAYRIDEAAEPTEAAAVTIEPVTPLVPAITAPDDPPTYTFRATHATLETGWYRVVWLDGQGAAVATAWYEYLPVPAYAPSVGDVATILRARAVEPGGHMVVSFTDQTNPTAQSVQNMIALFTPQVFARLGRLDNLGCENATDLRSAARTVAAQRVALEVQGSYWPEEVGESVSYERQWTSWDADVTALMSALAECRASSDDGGDGGESTSRSDPAWRYPPACPLRF